MLHPMEICGERAVVREEFEGEGAAAHSSISAWPCRAVGFDAESKQAKLVWRG